MNQGRPVPLHGIAAEPLMAFALWHRRAMRDRVIDEREALEAVPILLELAPEAATMSMTLEHVHTCTGSPKGVYGHQPQRSMRRLIKRGANVIAFPAQPGEDDAA